MSLAIPISNTARGALFGASGLIGLTVGSVAVYNEHMLTTQGIRTHGFVIGKDDTCSYRTCDKNLRFRYQSSDGRQVVTSQAVHHSIWKRLGRGDRVPITYRADEPTTYRFELHSNYRKSEVKRYGFGFGILFMLVGLGFALVGRFETRY